MGAPVHPLHDSVDPVADNRPEGGHPRDRSGPTGVISLETTFWAMGALWLMSRVRVELDGERRELPWGHLRLPVAAGTHRLRISCKYLWMDAGAASRELDVRSGQTIVLRYRAPVLVFLAGKLRQLGQEPARPEPEASGSLGQLAPAPWVTPGWYADPSDALQRRWWDGDGWTPATFRPIGTGRKAWVLGLTAVTLPIAWFLGGWIGSSLGSDPADSTGWVTVTEVDGVRFDLPRRPHHQTQLVPGTDVTVDIYQAGFDDIEVGAFVSRSELRPGDTRTDAQVLDDSADGMATNISGTIVDSRPVEVDGAHGRDLELTTPQEGGLVVLARVVFTDDDLLLGVQTVFDPNDREAATAAHDRMARSIDFDGEDAGDG
jgi:hypothetical protein